MLLFIIAIILLGIGAYTDIKYRKASNWLWVVMGGIGTLSILAHPLNLIYILMMFIILGAMFTMFFLLPMGGADIKALMALAILFPYPLGDGWFPPVYLILAYATFITVLCVPYVKWKHAELDLKDILNKYPFPFIASILGAVVLLMVVDDVFAIMLG